MPTRSCLTHLLLLSSVLALSGCFSLSRDAPAQQHYVLGAGPEPPAAAETAALAESVVGLRSPRIADYLTEPFIVVRSGQHRIGFSRFHRWGEALSPGFSRTLAGHLGARAPRLQVVVAPWPEGIRPDYLVQVHLARFEGVTPDDETRTQGEAHMLATWEILRQPDGERIAAGTTEVRETGWPIGDFDALLALLEEGVATLARDLVAALEAAPGS